jgi:hypothetical protein
MASAMRKLLYFLLVILVLAIVAEGIGIALARRNVERLDAVRMAERAEIKRLEGVVRLNDRVVGGAWSLERKLRAADCLREEGSLPEEAAEAVSRLREALEEVRP